jgi:hypothetical protein
MARLRENDHKGQGGLAVKTSHDARAAALEALETATAPDLAGNDDLDLRLALDRYYIAATELAGALAEAGL